MQKWLLLGLSGLLAISCSTASRAPQSIEELEASEKAKFEQSFQNVMTVDEALKGKDRDIARTKKMDDYLRRQMSFFYLGHGMVNTFDKELDRLYREKVKNPQAEVNTETLKELNFKLNIAREFIERNNHELEYVYSRLLEEGNGKGELKQAATFTLSKINTMLERGRKESDPWAVSALAENLTQMGKDIKRSSLKAKVLNLNKFIIKAKDARDHAYQASLKFYESRKDNLVDKFVQKEWEEYQSENRRERQDKQEARTPNAVAPYPDSGTNGNISGATFPAGVWALTFDDGPHATHTRGMLDALKLGNYQGTFFWLTENIKRYPEIVRQVRNEGSRRASHSYTHANLPKLGETGLTKEIDTAAAEFEQIVGSRPTFFRCPYGACGSNGSSIRQHIANNNMIHVFWNVDTLDWQDKNPSSIFQRAKKQMEVNGKGIVLFHDIHPQSVEATKLLVNYLKTKSDWQVLPLDEIVKMKTGSDYPSP